jgi:acyl carrier protein
MLDRSHVADLLLVLTRQFAPGLPARDALARSASLGEFGLTSMAVVRLMLSIEAAFAIAIPDAELIQAQIHYKSPRYVDPFGRARYW